jgi:hypothetical protein
LPIAMEVQYDYSSGHHNSPGQYFLELPLYLLPWTLLAAYALEAAWRGARRASVRRAGWRFALCAAVPGLLVLSIASTARSIYAAPCMMGFAMLMALSIERLAADVGAARRVLASTALLLLLVALVVLGANAALQWSVLRAPWPLYLLSSCTAAVIAAWCAKIIFVPRTASTPRRPVPERLQQFAIAWCLLLSVGLLCLGSAVNRAQDLESLAQRAAWSAGADPLLLWNPDETTLAWAQLYLPAGGWRSVESANTRAGTGANALPANAVVASLVPGRWSREQWLAYLGGDHPSQVDGAVGAAAGANEPLLSAAGFAAIGRIERPGGRGYFLWRRTDTEAAKSPGAKP